MLIRDQIKNKSKSMTQSERKLATALLSDYPYAGLISIHELADRADVSPRSISRFVTKIRIEAWDNARQNPTEVDL